MPKLPKALITALSEIPLQDRWDKIVQLHRVHRSISNAVLVKEAFELSLEYGLDTMECDAWITSFWFQSADYGDILLAHVENYTARIVCVFPQVVKATTEVKIPKQVKVAPKKSGNGGVNVLNTPILPDLSPLSGMTVGSIN